MLKLRIRGRKEDKEKYAQLLVNLDFGDTCAIRLTFFFFSQQFLVLYLSWLCSSYKDLSNAIIYFSAYSLK